MSELLVELRDVSVRFGGVQALRDVSLDVKEGSTFGIIGPNGAGKTTLFNCISGFIRSSDGSMIKLGGQEIRGMRVDRIARLGVGRTFQNISLIKTRSVRENILTGLHLSLRYGFFSMLLPTRQVRRAEAAANQQIEAVADLLAIPRRILDQTVGSLSLGLQKKVEVARALVRQVRRAEAAANQQIEAVADLLAIPRRILDQTVGSLSLGLQKKVEVARALVRRPRLLLLDEPAGGLNDAETADLVASLRNVMDAKGLTIVLIDHDMSFVMPLCDRICVLNFGNRIAFGSPRQVAQDAAVIECYLGSDLAA